MEIMRHNVLMEEMLFEKFLKERIRLKQKELTLKKGTYQDEQIQRKVYAQTKAPDIHWLELLIFALITILLPISLLYKPLIFIGLIILRKGFAYLIYAIQYTSKRYYQLIQQIEKQQILLQKQLNLTKNYLQK